jgi:hypothetical protein
MEIACFDTGVTTRASCQKSFGIARNSVGDVRAISASDTRRKRARLARPWVGVALRLAGFDSFGITTTLLAIAETGTDEATHDGVLDTDAIGKNNRQRNPVRYAERDHASFTVIAPRVIKFDVRRRKDERREFEIEAAPREILVALLGIPVECHLQSYTCIYTEASGAATV